MDLNNSASPAQPSVQLLQAVLDALPFCVFWKDRHSIGIGCNQALADVAGLATPAEYLGKSDYDLPWTKEEADFFRECDRRVMESGKAEVNIIESQLQSNQRLAWLETSKIPLTDAHGNIIGVLGAFHDITERKRLEDEHIASQKLESLATLSAGLAHDFNNVLMMILGNCQLTKLKLNNGATKTETLKYLDNIEKATSRASTITNQFMSYSESGPVTKTVCNISKVLDETVSLVQASIQSPIAYNISNTEDALYADINQIQQVIYNLIINAAQASKNNEEILITLSNADIHPTDKLALRPGKYLTIAIKDHGVGITDPQKEEIFKPYYTTKEHGHGLGLSACLTTIVNHNGIIEVESIAGLGSIFTVYLPVYMQVTADNVVHPPFSDELIYGKGKVLYIEDDLNTQAATLEILQELGYQVRCYASLKPAIRFIKAHPDAFDIVVTDFIINNAVQGGSEILDCVRDVQPDCPVILITGYYKQLQKRQEPSHQFSYIVQKPVGFAKISQIISRYMLKAERVDEHNQALREPEQTSTPTTGRNILVVDDDLLVANFLKSYLSEHNYHVFTALDGHLALAKLTQQPIDLIITDQSMQEMTGIELSQKVKRLYPEIPIILNSGYGDDALELDIKKIGINHFHKKSSNPEELIEAIAQLL